ncbi:hypothetical protein [Methylobacterium sp. ID0610]|uniref:hypothetical protein n=1 Tax=Methylobacterium carpenticola TaxID=3344827 RepID=UPI0036CD8972
MGGQKFRGTATIVPFPASAPRTRRPETAEPERGAILLFTGVRYERPCEPAPRPAEPSGTDLRKRG